MDVKCTEICPVCARPLMPGAAACACGWNIPSNPSTPAGPAGQADPRFARWAQIVFMIYGLLWTLPVFIFYREWNTVSDLLSFPFILFLTGFMLIGMGAYVPGMQILIIIIAWLHFVASIAVMFGCVLIILAYDINGIDALPILLTALFNMLLPIAMIRIYRRERNRMMQLGKARNS